MSICSIRYDGKVDYGYVMENGKVVFMGNWRQILRFVRGA